MEKMKKLLSTLLALLLIVSAVSASNTTEAQAFSGSGYQKHIGFVKNTE